MRLAMLVVVSVGHLPWTPGTGRTRKPVEWKRRRDADALPTRSPEVPNPPAGDADAGLLDGTGNGLDMPRHKPWTGAEYSLPSLFIWLQATGLAADFFFSTSEAHGYPAPHRTLSSFVRFVSTTNTRD